MCLFLRPKIRPWPVWRYFGRDDPELFTGTSDFCLHYHITLRTSTSASSLELRGSIQLLGSYIGRGGSNDITERPPGSLYF